MMDEKLFVAGGSFTIHPVREGEEEAILGVYRECEDFLALGPQPKASMEMVKGDLELSRSQGGVFCGIYAGDGRMIGVLDFVRSGWEGDAQRAYLSLLMIGAPWRGCGIGREVVELFEAEIRKDPGVTAIMSGVQVNNPAGIRFWERNGYRLVSGPEPQPDQTVAYSTAKTLTGES